MYQVRRFLVSIWPCDTHIFISVYSAGPDNVYHLPFLCHHPYHRAGDNPKLKNHTSPPNEQVSATPIYPVIRHETDLPIVKRKSDAYIATIIGATKNSVQSTNQVFMIKIGDFADNGESDACYFISIMSSNISTCTLGLSRTTSDAHLRHRINDTTLAKWESNLLSTHL